MPCQENPGGQPKEEESEKIPTLEEVEIDGTQKPKKETRPS